MTPKQMNETGSHGSTNYNPGGQANPRRSDDSHCLRPPIDVSICLTAADAAEVAALSPLRTLRQAMAPLHLSVGGAELPELQRQSTDYAAAAQAPGLPVRLSVLPGHHHFSIMDEIARPDGALVRDLRELIAQA